MGARTAVLAYTSPGRGHLFPIVPVLTELAARGHRVHVRTLSAYVAELNRLGLVAAPLACEVEALEHDDWRARSVLGAQRRAMDFFRRRAPLEAADLASAVAAERPEVLLIDVVALGALAVAEASGLPWAAWLTFPAWLRRPGVPPYGPGLRPLPGPTGRVRDAVVARAMASVGRLLCDAANAGRAAAGLAAVGSSAEILLRPPCLLSMTSAAFEYPGAWPASFHLVGSLCWDPPAPPPDWLTADPRPVVLITTSSELQDDGALVQTAFEALHDRHDLLVLATLPAGTRDGLALPRPPANARVERFLPHAAVLPRAVAVICHGGAGITQRALAAGVPVVAVPFGRDQPEVARRLERTGAGVRLPAGRLTPARLRSAFEQALQRRERARRLARDIALAGGSSEAADLVESLGYAAGSMSTVGGTR